ncbi:MAG: hypothetical protein E6J34_17595 [Chloroflexi bacterium]|nr:MAG: hypothetical protein E6J34_17595 [Chloroflexota bacterium]
MSQQQEHRIVKKKIFSQADQVEILQLAERCNQYEHLHLRLSSDMLREYSRQGANNPLYYVHGKLVGCILVDSIGNERELIEMVHPDYPRQGIFRWH